MIPETRLGLYQVIAGALEKTGDIVPPNVVTAIKELRAGRGLPVAVARYQIDEAMRIERSFIQKLHLPAGTLGRGNEIISFHMLYSLAPGHILEVAGYSVGEDVVEKNIEEGIRELGVSPEAYTSVEAAQTHVFLDNLVQLLRKDPTGFMLVDRIAYGAPIPNSPLTIVHQYPPLVRIIELGAERYKTLYRVVYEAVPPQNLMDREPK